MEKYAKRLKRDENDTGSPEYQIGRISERIDALSEHLKENKKDNSARKGLLMLVQKRRRLLTYLERTDEAQYRFVLSVIGMEK